MNTKGADTMETIKYFSFNAPKKALILTRRLTREPVKESYPVHSHVQLEIVLCNEGTHGYSVGGETVALTPGSLIAIAPGVPHQVLTDGKDYDRFSVFIHPTLLPQGAIEEFKQVFLLLRAAPESRISRHLRKIERYAKTLPTEAQKMIFPALAVELYYMLVRSESTERNTSSDIINRALAYIDKNYGKIRSILEVSDSLYVSKSYFYTLFKEHMHTTPLAYLNDYRLHIARVRILSGERPTAVFRECGFEDYTSFFRSYKARYGTSPSDTSFAESDADDF